MKYLQFWAKLTCLILHLLHFARSASDVPDPKVDPDAISKPCIKSHQIHQNSLASGESGHSNEIQLVSFRWDEYDSITYFTLMILVVSLFKVVFHLIPKLSNLVPESCLLILVGLLTGLVLRFGLEDKFHNFPKYTDKLFFNILLPPIILDAAYTIYEEDFLYNLDAILLFALGGTLFNAFSIGGLLYGVHKAGLMPLGDTPTGLKEFLVFSTIISAVDPVAVLAIFEEIHINSVLYFIVFGESLFNDGVTIVLYNTLTILNKMDEVPASQYVMAIVWFFVVVLGGILVGSVVGILNTLTLRLIKHDHVRVMEPVMMLASAYLAYILAEIFHWSGIISLIACGIVQKRYAFLNASKKTYTTVKYSVKTLSSISDCIICIFLGKVATERTQHVLNWPFIVWSIFFCIVVRFVGVYGLTAILNKSRKKPLNLREQFIVAYGGLRGAVGFSLVLVLDPCDYSNRTVFITTTLAIIFFTVFVQGGTIKLFVNLFKIARKERQEQKIFHDVNKKSTDLLMTGMESILGRMSMSSYFHMLETFEDKYVKKIFLAKKVRDKITLKLEKITLDEHYARLYGPTILVCQSTGLCQLHEENVAQFQPDFEDNSSDIELRSRKGQRKLDPSSSLRKAFRSSSYEAYRRRKFNPRQDQDDSDELWESNVLRQLRNRRLVTQVIERGLIQETIDEDQELMGGPKRKSFLLFDHDVIDDKNVEDGQGWSPRKRSYSNMSAVQVKKKYFEAKKSYKK